MRRERARLEVFAIIGGGLGHAWSPVDSVDLFIGQVFLAEGENHQNFSRVNWLQGPFGNIPNDPLAFRVVHGIESGPEYNKAIAIRSDLLIIHFRAGKILPQSVREKTRCWRSGWSISSN